MYKIVKANAGTVRKIADNKSVNNLITKEDASAISLATTEGKDFYGQEVTRYNRAYFVLEGTLEVNFDGEYHRLSVGDACYIDAGTKYEMKGTFKAVVVNQPAFGT